MATCRCCKTPEAPTPALVWNRPGLSAVAYRIGTFASFREAMVEEVALIEVDLGGGVKIRPLSKWTARTSDDYGIVLLELWAYVGDVLTFYHERTFNEALLRTALFPESVLGLCRLLDYKPAPGAAAAALLAFTLERGKQLLVPVGLRVQSVPGPNEKPQKFETVEARPLWTSAATTLRIFPRPTPYGPLKTGTSHAWVKAEVVFTTPLVKNDTLVAFVSGTHRLGGSLALPAGASPSRGVEEKRVEAVQTLDGRRRLDFTPEFQKSFAGGQLFRWSRKLRLFGAQAPDTYLTSTPDSNNPRILIWKVNYTPIHLSSGTQELALEGAYDHLKAGQRLLLHAPQGQRLLTVTEVKQVHRSLGPFSATVTVVGLKDPLGVHVADLRAVVLYELAEPEITLDGYEYPPTLTGNRIYLHPEDAAGIEAKHLLIVDDVLGNPQSVTVTAVDASDGHTVLTITPPLARALDQQTAYAWGNVVRATHGETVAAEVLGDGDASAPFQAFPLAKAPVTHVRTPGAPGGVVSTLEIRVDNILWHEVPSLLGHGGRERVYTTSRDSKEVMTARFGDNLTGARLTSGRGNVVARYRYGLGLPGNVKAGALRNPLDRPTGLGAVVNPLDAQGGADPETLDQARANAPNTVRTFGRIVSLRDFEDTARQFPGIARALAAWAWDGEEQAVHLTVAGDNGAVVSGPLLDDLSDDLDRRRDPNRKLILQTHRNVPILIGVAILVDPDHDKGLVQSAVGAALTDRFAFAHTALGQAVHLSDVSTVVQNVPGVVAADVTRLQFKEPTDRTTHGATVADPQKHLRIFRNEIPAIEKPSEDVAVTLGLS
jgi:hypothetical protein